MQALREKDNDCLYNIQKNRDKKPNIIIPVNVAWAAKASLLRNLYMQLV